MDSKPIVAIMAIVISIGAMGTLAVFGGNILSGTSASTDLFPKTVEVFSINEDHLEVNVQMTNQGQATIASADASIEINGAFAYNMTTNGNIPPYKTLVISGAVKDLVTTGYILPKVTGSYDTVADSWDIFPGQSVLLRITATTTSGDTIVKLHEITVK